MSSTATDQANRPVALVTGHSGFAGRHVAAQLQAAGWRVAGVARGNGAATPGVIAHTADICDAAALGELVERLAPRAVIHLAAIVDTVTTPSVVELQRVNVLGTVAVVEALRAAAPAARLVYASSAFVYGRTTPEEQPLAEDRPLRPLTPYGAGKAAAEAIVLQYVEAGGDAVIARAFQHTGPGHVGEYALADWARQLARMKTGGAAGEIAAGNLDVERDYLDVRDVAAAYVALAERGVRGGVYNVCSGEAVSMRALLEGLIEVFGLDARIVTDPERVRAVDQPRVVGDPSRLIADTGWAPRFGLAQTLAELGDFWMERVANA